MPEIPVGHHNRMKITEGVESPPTVEARYVTEFREVPGLEPGLVLEDDGTVNLIAPDGTRSPIGSGGAFQVADFLFNEPDGAHADLTASLVLAAGSTVLDVFTYALVTPWADGSAAFTAGDTPQPSGYYDAISLNGESPLADFPYAPPNSGFSNIDDGLGFYAGATPFWQTQPSVGGGGGGVLYPDGDTLLMTVSGIEGGGGGGQLLARVLYLNAVTPTIAT